ncbi:MAG: response regulator transcription factor, partial [Muribaculaceae bacterium]|nr:response regulator transcription factor [Muribaculaceae bacterium]
CKHFNYINVQADFDNAEDALCYIAKNKVDMVLMDMWLPKMNGIEASNILKRVNPELKIIMMIPNSQENGMIGSVFANADAFVLSDFDIHHFEKIMNIIFSGGYWFDFRFLHMIFKLVNILPKADYYYLKNLLTPLELSVMSLVLQGVCKTDIATLLNISVMDLYKCVNSLLKKFTKTEMAEQMLRRVRYDLV